MIRIDGAKLAAFQFDSHEHVCDLIDIDGPLLSLYTDSRNNWLYLWCDTDNVRLNRWMLIEVSRPSLVAFFARKESLRSLISESPKLVMLDETTIKVENEDEFGIPQEPTISIKRKFKLLDDLDQVEDYLPSAKSFFDPELAEGIDVQQEFSPSKHLIPVDGRWFFRDLDNFSRTYAKVYAFLYSTKPQFINSMHERLRSLLRAPWTGGYSRVNLFTNLRRGLPALHDLQIERFSYASPGAIEVEALPSICEDVSSIVLASRNHWPQLQVRCRIIDSIIGGLKLKKVDLSLVTDEELSFSEEDWTVLRNSCAEICSILGIDNRIEALRGAAPNLIVYAKAIQALVSQVEKLSMFELQGLLNFAKSQEAAEKDVQASAARIGPN